MKLLLVLLVIFSSTLFAEDIAIEALKKNDKIKAFLANKSPDQYWVNYHHMSLGGQCGFTGCQWQKLVSLVVTKKTANAPSTTIIALVSGSQPGNNTDLVVKFVELSEVSPSTW